MRGDVTLRDLAIHDGARPVITVARLEAAGIDAAASGRVLIDRVRVRGSWALIERDRQGTFLLRTLFGRPAAPPAPSPAPPAPALPTGLARRLDLEVREAVFEQGAVKIVDGVTEPPARFDIAGARLAVQDFAWPATAPMKIHVTSPTPEGGTLDVAGTLALEPLRLDARAVLDAVAVAPAQPYLPIEGRVAGEMSGDLAVVVGLDPVVIQVRGGAQLRRVRLADADRPLLTVGRVETTGIDVDWPRRIRVERMRLGRPRLLVERDATGTFRLHQLVVPRWNPRGASLVPALTSPARATGPAAPPAGPPTVEIGTLALERATARFVDRTTRPAYAEELNNVAITLRDLTTAPGARMRFAVTGALPGGASLAIRGEGTAGARPALDLAVDVRGFVLPRANPYLDRFTSWTATRGTIDLTAHYTLAGTRLDARHDVVLRHVEVQRSAEDDEVGRRLGLPLGLLVSVMKDARGEMRLQVPVSGDLATRSFDFTDAVWSAVRSLAIRLLALPFSRVGSVFVSEDSRLTGLAIAPVAFEPGTARLGPGMDAHVARVAGFLRDAPALTLHAEPIFTVADVDALKRAAVRARLAPGAEAALAAAQQAYRERWPGRAVPATLDALVAELARAEPTPTDAVRALAARRVEIVREQLVRAGGVDGARLVAPSRRMPVVEASGEARVELDLRS